MPVCTPMGGWKQSKPPVRCSVCSPSPICCSTAGLPPDHVFRLSMAVKDHCKLSSNRLQKQPPSGGEGWTPFSCPKHEAAASPSFLSTEDCAAATAVTRQPMLRISGTKWAITGPTCKPATREQAGTRSIGEAYSTTPAAHSILSEPVPVHRNAHGLIRSPRRHKQDVFRCLKTQLKNRPQL